MQKFLKYLFVIGPLAAQGVIQASGELGVTHPTVATNIAGWILAGLLAARGLASQDSKNLKEP